MAAHAEVSLSSPDGDAVGAQPLLSIGLAVYNGEAHLRASIESLLAQDVGDLELVISDNASSDSTAQICAEFMERDSRVRYQRNDTNIGAAANFNRVFELSNGRYYMWGSDDDLWAPSFARRCIEVLEQNAAAVMCSTGVELIDDRGDPIVGRSYANVDTRGMALPERVRALIGKGLWYDLYAVIRPEALRETALYRATYGGDLLLLLELATLGAFAVCDDTLLRYRLPALAKTASDHHAEILGAASQGEPSRPWTVLAHDCLDILARPALESGEAAAARDAFLSVVATAGSPWGRAILSENALPPSVPRSARQSRSQIVAAIEHARDPETDPRLERRRRRVASAKRALRPLRRDR